VSRTNPSDFEWQQLAYRCGFCGAPPGEWCVKVSDPSSYTNHFLHTDRMHQVEMARRNAKHLDLR
jgi:hypothetical protein